MYIPYIYIWFATLNVNDIPSLSYCISLTSFALPGAVYCGSLTSFALPGAVNGPAATWTSQLFVQKGQCLGHTTGVPRHCGKGL